VVRALRRQVAANADFSDALIIELARAHGCRELVSFDRKARGLGMRVL
jgi:predicted nucleic-acid-binding protein